LLGSNDHRVRKGVSGFQGIGKIDADDSSKESVGEESDICIVSRIRGVVRASRKGVRSGEFGSWDVVEF
jgi:hypothetical protein